MYRTVLRFTDSEGNPSTQRGWVPFSTEREAWLSIDEELITRFGGGPATEQLREAERRNYSVEPG
jgi:hypothetical protein